MMQSINNFVNSEVARGGLLDEKESHYKEPDKIFGIIVRISRIP